MPMPGCPDDFLNGTSYNPSTIDNAIRDWAQQTVGSPNDPNEPARSDNSLLLIRTASHPWEVIDDESLRRIAGLRKLERFLFMPRGYKIATASSSAPIPTVDFTNDFDGLVQSVRHHPCRTIYLQISPHTRSEYLLPLFRHLRPDAKLVVEFYDMGALYSPDRLLRASGYEGDEWQFTRLAAWVAARQADAVVTKMGGDDWGTLSSQFSSPVFNWFPMHMKLQRAASQHLQQDARDEALASKRIAFAGSLGDTELKQGPTAAQDANFLETLATLMNDKELELGVFNAADRRLIDNGGQKFEAVESWFSQFDTRHMYSPALPEDTLIEEMRTYGFGFFCVHYDNPVIEHVGRLAVPNRVMAYLCAGLPVIADSYVEFMGDIIRRFNAGLVVDPADFGELADCLRESDFSGLRAGAEALRQHLIDCNERTLDDISVLLSNTGT